MQEQTFLHYIFFCMQNKSFPSRYGNNAVQMETTAVYDKETKEFIVNTPTPLAQKYWITNGAVHARHCVVFAQLSVDGMYIQ